MIQVKSAVYLTADGTRAVPSGHNDAATLLVGVNGMLPDEVARKFGVTENGAPGVKGGSAVIIPSLVNVNALDGVNTAPGTPAATVLARSSVVHPGSVIIGKGANTEESPQTAASPASAPANPAGQEPNKAAKVAQKRGPKPRGGKPTGK